MGSTGLEQTRGEKTQGRNAVCRFFGRDDYGCDVGVPHPSAHDVEVMVRFCNGKFTQCSRYRMLAERWSGNVQNGEAKTGGAYGRDELLFGRPSSEVARGVLQHELRTPLASILAAAEILERNPERDLEVRKKFVGVICEESRRLKKTVEALFDGLEEGIEPAPVPQTKETVVQELSVQRLPSEKRSGTMSERKFNKGWSVVLAGTGINLALGILYAWSIFKGAISSSIEKGGEFAWDKASINDPYALCCLVFAFAMIVAGRVQDKIGPRMTAIAGGLLVGAGFIMASVSTSYVTWLLGFGVLAGIGIGFGYAAATPPALKWFPPARSGMIAGIVVSGFGLASVYIAPLSSYLLGIWGVQKSMFFFGVAFAAIVSFLALFLVNPPEGHLFANAASKNENKAKAAPSIKSHGDFTPRQMLKTVNFYTLWAIFFVGSGAGLMVIGSVAGMAKASLGTLAFVAVALMAVGNASGRIVAGMLSDRIGRANTLLIMLSAQAVLMFAAIPAIKTQSALLLVVLATFIGFNYGTNLSLFPSLAKDFWGLKNFGLNYGVLFSAWGVGGFVMGRVSEMIKASTGSFDYSFITAGVALVIGAALTLTLREGKKHQMAVVLEEETKKAEEIPVRGGRKASSM